jgi:hypothetical protein
MARRCTYCRDPFIPEGIGRRCNTCGAPEPIRLRVSDRTPARSKNRTLSTTPKPGFFWMTVAVLMAILTIFLPSDLSRWVRSLPA